MILGTVGSNRYGRKKEKIVFSFNIWDLGIIILRCIEVIE